MELMKIGSKSCIIISSTRTLYSRNPECQTRPLSSSTLQIRYIEALSSKAPARVGSSDTWHGVVRKGRGTCVCICVPNNPELVLMAKVQSSSCTVLEACSLWPSFLTGICCKIINFWSIYILCEIMINLAWLLPVTKVHLLLVCFLVLGIALRALCLLGKHHTTWTTPLPGPPFFFFFLTKQILLLLKESICLNHLGSLENGRKERQHTISACPWLPLSSHFPS
jgi:hypothetical protein